MVLKTPFYQMIAVEDIDFDKIKIMEPSDVIDNRDFQQALAVDPIQRWDEITHQHKSRISPKLSFSEKPCRNCNDKIHFTSSVLLKQDKL